LEGESNGVSNNSGQVRRVSNSAPLVVATICLSLRSQEVQTNLGFNSLQWPPEQGNRGRKSNKVIENMEDQFLFEEMGVRRR